jgi:hypothetical protein
MKESTLVNMKHDIGSVLGGLQNTIKELVRINTLQQGMLETIKRMPGYQEAIDKLLDEQREEDAVKQVADMVEKEIENE